MEKGLFIVIALLVLAGCKKDDTETSTPQPTVYPNETKLKSYTYTNERIVLLGTDFTNDLKRPCDLDNDYNFIDSGQKLITDNSNMCPNSTGSWKTGPGTWKMIDANTVNYYNTDMTISFTSTQLILTEKDEPTSYTTLDIK